MIPSHEEMTAALAQRHGESLQRVFSSAKVAICGLGGLGSNIAVSLARAGIGKLILIDFDRVDITNLHRQQYKANQIGMFKCEALAQNLSEIAPYVQTEPHCVRLTEENCFDLLFDADIICEAFDKAENKSMLVNYALEHFPDKYLVAASGMAGIGSPNEIVTRRVSKRFYLCGDGKSDVNECGSLFSARVMLCAAHQAHTVLRILAKEFED